MSSETEVRDRLALDRTLLANERTLLAYVRTALALVAGGAALLQFGTSSLAHAAGWGCIGAGALLLPVGVFRFVSVRRRLRARGPE